VLFSSRKLCQNQQQLCPDFCTRPYSINGSHTAPRFLCQTVQKFNAAVQQLMQLYLPRFQCKKLMQPYSNKCSCTFLDFCANKCSRTALNVGRTSPRFLCSNTPPQFLCQHLMLLYSSSISVQAVNLSLSCPENRALLSVFSNLLQMCFSHFSPSSSLGNRALSKKSLLNVCQNEISCTLFTLLGLFS